MPDNECTRWPTKIGSVRHPARQCMLVLIVALLHGSCAVHPESLHLTADDPVPDRQAEMPFSMRGWTQTDLTALLIEVQATLAHAAEAVPVERSNEHPMPR